MKDDNNRHLGTVVVLDDLTELIKAQKIAAWQEMARGLAHEIKNPLTPIQLSAQRLKKKYREKSEGFETVFEDCVDTIISQVEGLRGLVDEFSRFARLPDAQPKPHNLHSLIDEVVLLYQISHKNIEVQRFYDERIEAVEVDEEQIKRVLINLLENAIEAMEGLGRIQIRTVLFSDGRSFKLEVSDEGKGISPEDRDKLFLPYFSTKKRGTGLGLAIVNRIVGDHRGTLAIRGNYPQGTIFVITLPV
jgi:two-component system nitrogen regulation sensor histidine kinase NtrY